MRFLLFFMTLWLLVRKSKEASYSKRIKSHLSCEVRVIPCIYAAWKFNTGYHCLLLWFGAFLYHLGSVARLLNSMQHL